MKAYEKELLDNSSYFVETPCLNEEVERVIALEEEQREAMMVYSPAPVGKNFAFRNALNKKEGNKIFINFNDLSYMSSFPAYYIVKAIYDKLDELGIPHRGDFPNTPPSDVELDVETRLDVLLGVLKTDLYCLKLDKPLYILIGNCDYPFDNDFSLTFYRHFIFDKRRLPDNLYVFLITSSNLQIEENKEYLNVLTIEGNKDNPKLFFKELMSKYGRIVNDELLLLANPSLTISDYIYIAAYVINYCGLKESDYSLRVLLSKNNTDEILLYIFNDFYSRLSKYGRVIFAEALVDLYMSNLGLSKDQILNSGRYLLGGENELLKDFEEISREEKAIILADLEFFTKEEEGRLIINDKIIKDFIGTNAMLFTNIVCDSYKDRLLNAIDHLYGDKEYIEKKVYSVQEYMPENATRKVYKDIYIRDIELEDRFSKKNVARYAIFNPLSARLVETIDGFEKMLEKDPDVDKVEIEPLKIFMISYVERASVIYQSGLDYGAFYQLFRNRLLMYMLLSKSRRLVRRILTRFINCHLEYQRRILNVRREDRTQLQEAFEYELRYLFEEDKYKEQREQLIILLGEVLRENDALFSSKIKDFYQGHNVTPVSDFVLVTGSDELNKELDRLEEQIRAEKPDFNQLIEDLKGFSRKYEDTENVFHKLMYAYLAFRTYLFLGENKKADKALGELLNPVMEDILIYTEYCYFPEMYGMIYAHFGRIYPKDYLDRMARGVDFLKSQGYLRSIKEFMTALNYFSSLRIKEDK